MSTRLPAEWEEQDAVLLVWPHADSDWRPWLPRAEAVFARIIEAVTRFETALVVTADRSRTAAHLQAAGARMERVRILEAPSNDTWARDLGPLTVERDGKPVMLDFGFNGWGLKFAANLDNQITKCLHRAGAFGQTPLETVGLVLEGGSIESDGQGTILTTSECLLNPNRNPHLSRDRIEMELAQWLGAQRVLWLESGHLVGDDTDSHIDTLARLAPDHTIVYVRCDDAEDEHFPALSRMEEELRKLRTAEGAPYRLIPLPWPNPCYDEDGARLPATYANYLVLNSAVLMPTYEDPNDHAALAAVARAFPGREVVGIDCSALILQHGSLHCVTMQIPKGVLP